MLPLFERYPLLREKLPYISLGEFPTPVEKLERLGQAINAPYLYAKREDLSGKLLHSHEPSFPEFEISEQDFEIRYTQKRPKGQYLSEGGAQAIIRVKDLTNLQLDEVFTANAFAQLLADAAKGLLRNKPILWWNSYNSRDFSNQIAAADYRQLPKAFHRYFERA